MIHNQFNIHTEVLADAFEVDDNHKWGYELRMVNEEEYCGKLLVLFPGHKSSLHYHKVKKETFIVLAGRINIEVYGHGGAVLVTGDRVDIAPLQKHRFYALGDKPAMILEVSTHHDDEDTYRVEDSV